MRIHARRRHTSTAGHDAGSSTGYHYADTGRACIAC